VLREMAAPGGGFYATQDADSEGEEGKFFVWTPEEIRAVLDAQTAGVFEAYYGVTTRGNFEGKNILHVRRTAESVAKDFDLTLEQVEQILAGARARLFAEREKRIKSWSSGMD
jgi:uncharacterized protein YyaL (SSP411 family)